MEDNQLSLYDLVPGIQDKNVVVFFSMNNCTKCTATKRYLDAKSVPFVEINVTVNPSGFDYLVSQNVMEMPAVYVHNAGGNVILSTGMPTRALQDAITGKEFITSASAEEIEQAPNALYSKSLEDELNSPPKAQGVPGNSLAPLAKVEDLVAQRRKR
jgi:glutaredoxin